MVTKNLPTITRQPNHSTVEEEIIIWGSVSVSMCEVEECLARDFVAVRWPSYTGLMLLDDANGQRKKVCNLGPRLKTYIPD